MSHIRGYFLDLPALLPDRLAAGGFALVLAPDLAFAVLVEALVLVEVLDLAPDLGFVAAFDGFAAPFFPITFLVFLGALVAFLVDFEANFRLEVFRVTALVEVDFLAEATLAAAFLTTAFLLPAGFAEVRLAAPSPAVTAKSRLMASVTSSIGIMPSTVASARLSP